MAWETLAPVPTQPLSFGARTHEWLDSKVFGQISKMSAEAAVSNEEIWVILQIFSTLKIDNGWKNP